MTASTYKLRPHQQEAFEGVMRTLQAGDRAQAHMACGSGKTLVGSAVVDAMNTTGKKRVVVFVPSLALAKQTIDAYMQAGVIGTRGRKFVALCSDRSLQEDELTIEPDEFGYPLITRGEEVVADLQDGESLVVFTTYQSSRKLAGLAFDLGIFDEAHRTAGDRKNAFGFALSDKNISIGKRLFMTATPRHEEVEKDQLRLVHTMGDEKVYGPVAYQLSFREAITRELIRDYEVLISVVREKNFDPNHRDVLLLAIQKACEQFGIKKVFTFHSTVAEAQAFAAKRESRGMALYHVNGGMRVSERQKVMAKYTEEGVALVSNARCLTEGVDVPATDMVVFAGKKSSRVDIVQAAGRAMRRSGGKVGYIFLPVYVREGAELPELHGSEYRTIVSVLQALREQDQILRAALSHEAGQRNGSEGGRIAHVTVSDDEQLAPEVLDQVKRAVSVRILRTFAVDPEGKKKRIRELAESGAPRPSGTIGQALRSYLSSAYDPELATFLRETRPDWFQSLRTAGKKEQIRALALSGAPRPATNTPLERPLGRYINANRSTYDSKLAAFLYETRPDWFPSLVMAGKKEQIRTLALSGAPRPATNTALGRALQHYVSAANGSTYDSELAAFLRETRPDWFRSLVMGGKKEQIRALARSGSPRPRGPLGHALNNYLNPSGPVYDRELAKVLQETRPDWFRSFRSLVMAGKKEQIRALALSGTPRPSQKTPLGQALNSYLNPQGSYDAELATFLRETRPEWFKDRQSQTTRGGSERLAGLGGSASASSGKDRQGG